MIENGYIRYKNTEIAIGEDGNPIKMCGAQWSDYIPACIEGNRSTDNYNAEGGVRYEKPTYTVYFRRSDAKDCTETVKLYDRNKECLGQYVVRTKEISPIVNQVRITV